MAFQLIHNAYGKSAVRITKVVRPAAPGGKHELFEIDAEVQLEGDFVAAYTAGDNRNLIATDTMKNTVYVLAKENAFSSIEEFAMILARHFVATYPQVSKVTVCVFQSAWRRIDVEGKPHDHAFTSDGPQRRYASAVLRRGAALQLSGGVRGLLVLKTTASEWKEFHSDRYRTLKDTSDRILATSIDATWLYASDQAHFNAAYDGITDAILRTFATQHSLGAQHTIQAMGEAALAACEKARCISFTLPNQHRIPFNLEPFGLKFDNDIYVATDEPHGLIHGTIERR